MFNARMSQVLFNPIEIEKGILLLQEKIMHAMIITLLMGCGSKDDSGTENLWESAPLASVSGNCPTIDSSQSFKHLLQMNSARSQFVLPSSPEPVCNLYFSFMA